MGTTCLAIFCCPTIIKIQWVSSSITCSTFEWDFILFFCWKASSGFICCFCNWNNAISVIKKEPKWWWSKNLFVYLATGHNHWPASLLRVLRWSYLLLRYIARKRDGVRGEGWELLLLIILLPLVMFFWILFRIRFSWWNCCCCCCCVAIWPH